MGTWNLCRHWVSCDYLRAHILVMLFEISNHLPLSSIQMKKDCNTTRKIKACNWVNLKSSSNQTYVKIEDFSSFGVRSISSRLIFILSSSSSFLLSSCFSFCICSSSVFYSLALIVSNSRSFSADFVFSTCCFNCYS